MTYLVNEIFYSIQGEGLWTGRPAVFCRFSRCNLWTGREQDRPRAVCRFCDTDFTAATPYTLTELVRTIEDLWPVGAANPMVVLTGGEPTLQADKHLILHLRHLGFYVAMETNGTRPVHPGLNWVCVSPKVGAQFVQQRGDELKVVYPQPGLDLAELARLPFKHFWLSPMDGPNLAANTTAALEYVLAHPQWRLNIQTHKVVGAR